MFSAGDALHAGAEVRVEGRRSWSRSCGPTASCQRTRRLSTPQLPLVRLREEAVGRTAEVDAHRRRDGGAARVDGQRLRVAGAAHRPRLVAGGHRCPRQRPAAGAGLEAAVGHEAVVIGVAEGLEGLGRRRRRARRLRGGGHDEDRDGAQQGGEPGAQPSRSKYIRQVRDPLVHVNPRSARVRLVGRQLSRVLETTVADKSQFGALTTPPIAVWPPAGRSFDGGLPPFGGADPPFGACYAAWRPPRTASRNVSKSSSMSALFSTTAWAPAALAWPSRPGSAVAV